MIDFLSQLKDAILNFQAKDFFDILIIAFLVYVVLKLFIKTKSIPILAGIIILVLLYGLAIFFNFPLTKNVLRSFFGMFLIILAIIFQRELRRFLGFLGVLGMRKEINLPQEETLRIITETIFHFAKNKIGALIVFPGMESIERHIEGGVYLNGKLSESLLSSIFDKNSSGHDGAVTIEGDRVKKFSVHLPLAENLEISKKYGTRHRAAIGITERSDTLCVIVSEERGLVSISRDGRIKFVSSVENLEKELRDFFEEKFPRKSAHGYKNFIKKNAVPFFVSVISALVFWFIFSYQSINIQKSFLASVEFRYLPEGSIVEDLSEPEIIVTLSGLDRDFKILDSELVKVSIDVSEMKSGWHKVIINKDLVKMPSGFSIVNIDPLSIKFKLGIGKTN